MNPEGHIDIASASDAHSTTPLGATKALLVFVVYIASQFVASILLGVVVGLTYALSGVHAPDTVAEISRSVQGPALVIGLIVSALIVVQMVRRFAPGSIKGRSRDGIGWSLGEPAYLLSGLVIGVALGIGYLSIASVLVPPDPDMARGPLAEMAITPGLSQLSWVFIAIVLAPPLEEFLFRGVLFSGIARSWGQSIAALLVTALFVIVHLPETRYYWPSVIAVLLLGITTLLMRVKSESLGPAVTLHLAYNLVLVITVSLVSMG
ncbi:MAG: lysostaphin resistance A-like protein [Candidatus Methylomirabilales bacterium]